MRWLTVCAVQVGKTEDIGSAALGIAVCAGTDGGLTSRNISRGSCDNGAANEGGDDGSGKHVVRELMQIREKMEVRNRSGASQILDDRYAPLYLVLLRTTWSDLRIVLVGRASLLLSMSILHHARRHKDWRTAHHSISFKTSGSDRKHVTLLYSRSL